jgi:hypothetical protein
MMGCDPELTLCGHVGELHLAIFKLQHMSTQVSNKDVFPSVSMAICLLSRGHIYVLLYNLYS